MPNLNMDIFIEGENFKFLCQIEEAKAIADNMFSLLSSKVLVRKVCVFD